MSSRLSLAYMIDSVPFSKFLYCCRSAMKTDAANIPVASARRAQHTVRGSTVKADILEGDPACPNLIASSAHGTKPVHYPSMVSQSI